MISSIHTRLNFRYLFLLFLVGLIGCGRSDKDVSDTLYKFTDNKVFKEVEEDSLQQHLQSYLDAHQKEFSNPEFLKFAYMENGFYPVLMDRHLRDSSLFHLIKDVENLPEHGISAKGYGSQSFKEALTALKEAGDLNAAYDAIARAEFQAADLLGKYSMALQYGRVNPKNVFKRYYIKLERPDSSSYVRMLQVKDLDGYLDSIQPKDTLYRMLQAELKKGDLATERKIQVLANLERLRWKDGQDSAKRVYVNVPEYKLYLYDDNKPVGDMKVVVGTGRNPSDTAKTIIPGRKDVPHSNETPMLSSLIHSVQVNPIWNIPESIASKEILVHAQQDRYYLVNNDIDVYEKNGKRIEDPGQIEWASYSKESLPYSFKQRPGGTNSLGLIKFLFENGSSVYLHDTPVKAAFDRSMRASSHGCVRVEDPLRLAHMLFGDSDKYKTIEEEMGQDNPKANTIKLEPKTQVKIDYMTAAVTDKGLTFFPDIYGLDAVLVSRLAN